MFTGIIRSVGQVVSAGNAGRALELVIGTGGLATDSWRAGDSICVAGACLTVVRVEPARFAAWVSRETLANTTLGSLIAGDLVNLEPALAAHDPLGGHYVTGHVDGVASVVAIREDAGSLRVSFEAPPPLARFLAPKGSVTVDGVSLTVNAASDGTFEANLVPHTRSATTLGALTAGRAVNLEVDILARYVARLLDAQWQR